MKVRICTELLAPKLELNFRQKISGIFCHFDNIFAMLNGTVIGINGKKLLQNGCSRFQIFKDL